MRDLRLMIDADLAALCGVTTKRLNEQVKRNADRFPGDFMFKLNVAEMAEVVANRDHIQRLKFSKVLPYAFTGAPIPKPDSLLWLARVKLQLNRPGSLPIQRRAGAGARARRAYAAA